MQIEKNYLYYYFVIASNRFLRCQRCYHIFKVISAEENNIKDVTEEHNKYKPPPFPKEVSNIVKWIIYYNVISVGNLTSYSY